MSTTTPDPRQTSADYDFIIVGSGAGGGPLACNLVKRGFRVLVLEAGGWDEPLDSQVPAFHPHASEDPALSWEFFVKHYTHPPQPDSKWDAAKDGIFYPRTATVGGCTQHNAMITLTGPSADWDEIAGLTDDLSWSGERMRTYFERLENCGYVPAPSPHRLSVVERLKKWLGLPPDENPGRHGFTGWLRTSMANPALVLKDRELIVEVLSAVSTAVDTGLLTVQRALKSVLTSRATAPVDPNDWQTLNKAAEGIALIPIAVYDGTRNGPRNYLRQILKEYPGRLTIQTETLVSRVVFDREPGAPGAPVAIGVRYLRGLHLYKAHPAPSSLPGEEGEVFARREVILAGGAYNTPQLLKLSGIGPREELERLGIPVRVELAGVGTNLQDRYEVGIISEVRKDFALLQGLDLGPPAPGRPPDAALDEWMASKTGLYATNAAIIAVLKKSRPDLDAPDLFVFALPGYFKGYYKGYSQDIAKRHDVLTWAVLKAHTKNRAGTVNLRSTDPRDVPEINFHYFAEGTDFEQDDLNSVLEGVKFVRCINEVARKKGTVKTELWPGNQATDDESTKKFIAREAWGHHASCTCPIGADGDPLAVLDGRFQVRGARGLRVVDASVFPRIPGVFIVTNVYMISEKASDVIAEDNRD